jgi:hypothetical protein
MQRYFVLNTKASSDALWHILSQNGPSSGNYISRKKGNGHARQYLDLGMKIH